MKKKALLVAVAAATLLAGCGGDEVPITETVETNVSEESTETNVLDLTWSMGYVGSAEHSRYPEELVTGNSGSNYSYTDVFTVESAGTTITFSDDNSNSNGDVKFASTNAYVISSWEQVDGEWVLNSYGANYAGTDTDSSDILVSYENGVVTYSYTTSVDNENLRLCYRSGEMPGFTPAAYPVVTAEKLGNEGTAADKLTLVTWIEDSKKEYYETALEGLTVNALGDSYFAGNGLQENFIWLNLMAKKYGMEMNNYGINGSMVSNSIAKYNPMSDRYSDMADNSPDIVLVEGGKNDFNNQIAIGSVDSTDKATYSGALNVIINGLKEKYPEAMIVCITPWNFKDKIGFELTYKDYSDAMLAVAEKQGVYCIEASNPEVSGVDMMSTVFRSENCMDVNDVSHLNLDGMKIAMTHFEKIIAEYWKEFQSK